MIIPSSEVLTRPTPGQTHQEWLPCHEPYCCQP